MDTKLNQLISILASVGRLLKAEAESKRDAKALWLANVVEEGLEVFDISDDEGFEMPDTSSDEDHGVGQ